MSKSQNINGCAYWTYGDNKKPVLIMIHGFRGTHHGLELIAKNLMNEYFVIIPDLPGFGDSKKLHNEHSIDNYSDWLKDFIDNLHLKNKPVILGHSFGSIVVSSFANKFSDMVEKLIIVNPIGYPALKGPKIVLSEFALLYYKIGKILPNSISGKWLSSKIVTQIMSSTMAKTRDRNLRKFIHEQHHAHFSSFSDGNSLSEAFNASIKNNVRDYVKNISVKTLIIAGDKDDITPIKRQLELHKMFKNSTIKIIQGVGHLTHYEKPAKVAGLIREFLK